MIWSRASLTLWDFCIRAHGGASASVSLVTGWLLSLSKMHTKTAYNLIERNFFMQQANNLKHTVNTKRTSSQEKSQSLDLNTADNTFHLLKRRLTGENPKTNNIWNKLQYKSEKPSVQEECNSLVMSVSRWLDAFIASNGYKTKC